MSILPRTVERVEWVGVLKASERIWELSATMTVK